MLMGETDFGCQHKGKFEAVMSVCLIVRRLYVCVCVRVCVCVCPHVVAGDGEMQIQALTCEMFTQA